VKLWSLTEIASEYGPDVAHEAAETAQHGHGCKVYLTDEELERVLLETGRLEDCDNGPET
jgi:hypothetical protein